MDIMKQRWEQTDKELAKLLKKIKKTSRATRDNIQSIFNGIKYTYQELFTYASLNELDRFNRIIQDREIDGYTAYKIKKIANKKRVKRSEIIEAMIIMEFYDDLQKKNKDIMETLETEVTITYEQALKECGGRVRPRLNGTFLSVLLLTPVYRGYLWKDYIDGLISYNASIIYRQMLINLQQERELDVDDDVFDKLFTKMDNSLLHRKEIGYEDLPVYLDKYSGSVDALSTYVVNKTVLQAYINYGIKEVLFVAEYDNKTTDMCKTLDGQTFKIDEMNYYNRYSSADGRIVKYTTEGLVVGDNLPPINNHFHWCRSTIIAKK